MFLLLHTPSRFLELIYALLQLASDPSSVLGLLSGGDIEILEFYPPPLTLPFSYDFSTIIYGGGPIVELVVDFSVSVTVEYAIVLDSKGIRQAVEERNPLKALESFALRDTFKSDDDDGTRVDKPLVIFEAEVGVAVEVSAVIVKIGARGSLTVTVEIDLFDPYPETSNGLVRPFELLSIR